MSGNRPRVSRADITDIIIEVAKEARLAPGCLVGRDRRRHVVAARDKAMLAVRRLTRAGYELIGEMFGGRSHTSVMAAIWRAEGDERYVRKLADMKRRASRPQVGV